MVIITLLSFAVRKQYGYVTRGFLVQVLGHLPNVNNVQVRIGCKDKKSESNQKKKKNILYHKIRAKVHVESNQKDE